MSTRAEVHFLIRQPGFRTKEIILVTTLLDAKTYARNQLAKLYQLRWLSLLTIPMSKPLWAWMS